MLDLAYRVVQDGRFINYVIAHNQRMAEKKALEKFGANCIVMKLVA